MGLTGTKVDPGVSFSFAADAHFVGQTQGTP
jgi:hypothetical protein